jgi:hypothetical protein
MRKTYCVRVLALGVLATAGCTTEPTHLMHYQRTVMGFDAAVATQEASGHIILGYDRRMVSVVPKTTLSGKAQDAMSIISCTKAKSGFTQVDFDERLATGEAAVNYAAGLKADPQSSSFSCVNEGSE